MRSLSKILKNIVKSNIEGGFEIESVRKAVIVNLFSLIGIFFGISYGIRYFIINELTHFIVLLIFSLIALFSIIYMRITKNFTISSYIIVSIMFSLCLFLFISGGEGNTGFLWFFVFPILSLFTLGRLKGFIAIFVLFLIAIILLYFHPIFMTVYDKKIMLRFFTSFTAVSAMAFVFEYVREKTYQTYEIVNKRNLMYLNQMQQQQEEIITQSNELEKMNFTLEQRVQDELLKNRDKDLMLIQQSRHAAMGEMIGNIAHQWRQPLNAVGIIIQNFKEAYDYNELNEEYIEKRTKKAMELIVYMSQTIDDFRNFFKPDKEKILFSIKSSINKSLSFLESTFKNKSIALEVIIEKDYYIFGYPNEYSQVIINILSNAKDALLSKKINQAWVRIELLNINGIACLKISDNAGGIPEQILDKIFDPYFTTKDSENGTGLGLYMAKTIIEKNMEGKIFVSNNTDGAVFTIENKIEKTSPEIS